MVRLQESFGPAQVAKGVEAGATHESSRQQGYQTIYSPQIFKEKMAASEEYVDHGMYPEIKRDMEDLGEAAIYTINLYANGVFIKAFTSTALFYGDVKPLASVGHTQPNGGTAQSNASSAGITLTEINQETGIIALRQQKNGNGVKLATGKNRIVEMVPESLEKESVIINFSTRRSGGLDNDLNWYLGLVNTYVNAFIGSDITDLDGSTGTDTQWHLFDVDQHGMIFNWDLRPSYKTWEDDDHDVMYNKVKYRCTAGWRSWVGSWHSKGDGLAYAS